MNRNKLKTYAPQARREFIQAVTDRAAQFGLSAVKIDPVTEKGDVVLISGKPFPKSVGEKRRKLEDRIKKDGFEQTIEAMAYTWFNRLVAIRFMELHGYLDHGFRVLSHPAGHSQPEILEHAQHVELAGLDQKQIVTLKLDGNKEEELYSLLILAQCNALHKALPFLFESLDDETELLLPDNLLHSDSLIRKLVNQIDEVDWQEVEIIGWLYQFYVIDEKKRVDDYSKSKPVRSSDIPAKTQLFTPNWIVKYLVQNTLGRQWLATYPNSAIRQQMQYYIEPAEQTTEAQEQLNAITPTSLNPEELTLLDPACGSGHILVEAYDLFKAIYEERGFRAKDIPALILQKNLFGLEIDDRAAQLAAFALMMKARADDRRIFDTEAKPNVFAIQDSQGMNAEEITYALNVPIIKEDVPKEYLFEEIQSEKDGLFAHKDMAVKGHVSQADIGSLLELFINAKTFGSLIHISPKLIEKLPEIKKRLDDVLKFGDLTHASVKVIIPILQQARLLAKRYDNVVANPPYMGSNAMNSILKEFARARFEKDKSDLFAMFMRHGFELTKPNGFFSMITMQSWMFLSSYDDLRSNILANRIIHTLAHLGPRAFSTISGEVVQTAAFVCQSLTSPTYIPIFFRLVGGDESQKDLALRSRLQRFSNIRHQEFFEIPGAPVAYWTTPRLRQIFNQGKPLKYICEARRGLATGSNIRFVRYWYEISLDKFGRKVSSSEALCSNYKWFPYNKGGDFRRWYGNADLVVNYFRNGEEIRSQPANRSGERSWRVTSEEFYFQNGITWGGLSPSGISARWSDIGAIFDSNKGPMMFPNEQQRFALLGLLSSKVVDECIEILNPTLSTQNADINDIPFHAEALDDIRNELNTLVRECVDIARLDWNDCEFSWEYTHSPLLSTYNTSLSKSLSGYLSLCENRIAHLEHLQCENNRLLLTAYGLADHVNETEETDIREEVTLCHPVVSDEIKKLLSYSIGCMMGRYSLNKPGLILANQSDNLETYLLKASTKAEPLPKVQSVEELDRIVLLKETVKCFGCGKTSAVEEAKFVIAGETTEEGQLRGRPLIYCAQCCDHDRASFVTMSMPLSHFSPKTAVQQKWCEPETLQIFFDLAECFGKRIPLRPEEVKFLPDDDGIIPLMEYSWFPDDAANRFEKFIATAWPLENLKENLDFVADSLGPKKDETAQETIRRYLATDFYKYHLSMYKKRPIYWLFSSGKQRGFQALVYLHRYNEGTLARMRTEYVVPLIGKMTARISQLGDEIDATSASPRKKILTTNKATITKQLAEVQAFEEKLRHYADQRIKLDLDDGVKVNYGKFGDLLADVKAICGTKDEE